MSNKRPTSCEESTSSKRQLTEANSESSDMAGSKVGGGHFPVHPRSRYDQTTPSLRRPMFVGDFSLDENRQFCHDRRNLYFITVDWTSSKKVNFDLSVSYDKVVRKNYEETRCEKLDRLLEWILQNTTKFHTKQSEGQPLMSLSTDFACFRGLLTELLCTPYEGREGWIICATKFRNTIYLCAYETPERRAQREAETDVQKKMASWGFKFEQYMTDGGDVTEGVNENSEYCCVMRSRLESHSLVYGAEVDGADPTRYTSPHADLGAFVELKTSREITSERDQITLHRHKLKKWWSQSYLVGIPRVVCGFRTNDGIVHSVKTFEVQDMPHFGQDYWKSNIMLNFLNQFLDFVKQTVQVDDPECVYKFERPPNGGDITYSYLGRDSQWSFLPKWYTEKILSS